MIESRSTRLIQDVNLRRFRIVSTHRTSTDRFKPVCNTRVVKHVSTIKLDGFSVVSTQTYGTLWSMDVTC